MKLSVYHAKGGHWESLGKIVVRPFEESYEQYHHRPDHVAVSETMLLETESPLRESSPTNPAALATTIATIMATRALLCDVIATTTVLLLDLPFAGFEIEQVRLATPERLSQDELELRLQRNDSGARTASDTNLQLPSRGGREGSSHVSRSKILVSLQPFAR